MLMLILSSACTRVETGQPVPVLKLIPALENEYLTKATVEDVPSLNERDLSGGIDVFISGHGSFLRYRVNSPQVSQVNFLTADWKDDGIVAGLEYDVYAVANPEYNPSQIVSEAYLKALDTGADYDIYRLYDPGAGSYDLSRTSSKQFLMDAGVKWTPTTEIEQTISLTLKRAAAKIEIQFSLSDAMSGYTLYGKPQWKLVNYATCCSILENGSFCEPERRTTPYMMDVTSNTATDGTIITYSYPHTWTDIDDATVIIMNVPLEDSSGTVIFNNYYAVPVADISGQGPYSLERNTLYRVQARLETLGSSGESSTHLPLGLLYEVIPWEYNAVVDDINVIGQEVDYLMVDPVEEEIREKVLSGGLLSRTIHLNFWSSGPISVTPAEVYYYDKNSNRINAETTSPVTVNVSGTKSGTIDITSTALSNNAVKYIRFRVSLTGNPALYKDIIIRHYPLDYIQNVQGLWSSLTLSNWVNWDTDQQAHTTMRYYRNDIFQAKVFYNSRIYAIEDRRIGGYYYAQRRNAYSNLFNNRMYVVQITSTSDSYTVGRVNLDSNSLSEDHFVSPAFLIASQLGATQSTNSGTVAALHCHNYREVTSDGRSYEYWRLPTREEIGIIFGYQYTSDTIDEVLSGDYYWALEGKAVSRTQYYDPSQDSGSGHVRCVRDLSEAELEQINVLN